jgi:hypothetical protein
MHGDFGVIELGLRRQGSLVKQQLLFLAALHRGFQILAV